jgi:hypothetical protein
MKFINPIIIPIPRRSRYRTFDQGRFTNNVKTQKEEYFGSEDPPKEMHQLEFQINSSNIFAPINSISSKFQNLQ